MAHSFLLRESLALDIYIEKRISRFFGGMVFAGLVFQYINPYTARDDSFVTIVVEIGKFWTILNPRGNHLNRESHGCRCQYAVRPDHLRATTGRSIVYSFLLEPLISNKSTTPQTWIAGC